jgi:hypothetical protein
MYVGVHLLLAPPKILIIFQKQCCSRIFAFTQGIPQGSSIYTKICGSLKVSLALSPMMLQVTTLQHFSAIHRRLAA